MHYLHHESHIFLTEELISNMIILKLPDKYRICTVLYIFMINLFTHIFMIKLFTHITKNI